MAPGRNRPCPCGSGEKHKNCHGPIEKSEAEREFKENQTIRLLSVIDEHFGDIVKQDQIVDHSAVKRFYCDIQSIWPQGCDMSLLYPEPSSSLRALYFGDVSPHNAIRNVCRFGLYVDEIYMFNPFLHPLYGMNAGPNVLDLPAKFIPDTIRSVLAVQRLKGWILSGRLRLVADPFLLAPPRLRSEIQAAVYNRRVFQTYSMEEKEDLKRRQIETTLTRTVAMNLDSLQNALETSEDKLLQVFADTLSHNIPNTDVDEMRLYVRSAVELYRRIPLDLLRNEDGTISEALIMRLGSSLEMVLLLSGLLGGFPYTDTLVNWKELLSTHGKLSEEAQVWSPLTHAFQELKFDFLDWVDPQFVLTIRNDGRLEGFRTLLKNIWKDIGGTFDPNKANSLARDFSGQLTQAHNIAKGEFEAIKIDWRKWSASSIATGIFTSMANSIVGGKMKLEIAAGAVVAGMTFGANVMSQFFGSRSQQTKLRMQNPMSIFIDLEKRGPSK